MHASQAMLKDKEDAMIIMSHKTIEPFSNHDVPGMAKKAGYSLKYEVPFNKDHYPGYLNRRGAGTHAGKTFPCNDAITFAFVREKYWQNKAPIRLEQKLESKFTNQDTYLRVSATDTFH